MDTYICNICGWQYSEEEGYDNDGILPGTRFSDISDDFFCPICGADKSDFEKLN